ncbi:hypothetical protein N3K66_007862 [Trichothecium roseum]|uniref:Uncharacterized protein n=1 Tax=Trichothecium roseum TaxID=47278 RepID=A0ACC0URU2_9HYPO|nr:hypothetical protein N3K66_007862 [Trichothecium roseum]
MYRPNDLLVQGQRIPNIFNTRDEAFHAKYTKPIGGFWTLSRVLELEPLLDETTSLFVDELTRRFDPHHHHQQEQQQQKQQNPAAQVCQMDEWIAYFAWDAAAKTAFGQHYGFVQQGRDVGGIIAESGAGLRYFAPVSQMPWLDDWLDKNPVLRIGPRPLVNGLKHTVRILAEHRQASSSTTTSTTTATTTDDEKKEKKKKKDDKKPLLFIDKYDSLKSQHDFVDDAQVTNWLMLNVLAGGDSTAGALRSAVYHLLKHPAAHARLVRELDDAAAASASNGFPPPGSRAVPQWSDVSSLPYLDACMRESARLTPALGLMLERVVPPGGFTLPVTSGGGSSGGSSDDNEAGGKNGGKTFFLPAGTKVGVNPSVVTRDRKLFGDDAAVFRPERWLRGEGDDDDEPAEAFESRRQRMRDAADLMYGAGNRACMGKHLAKLKMYKLFATLFSKFDVKLTSQDHEWKYFNAWFMYQSDIPVTLTRRQ